MKRALGPCRNSATMPEPYQTTVTVSRIFSYIPANFPQER